MEFADSAARKNNDPIAISNAANIRADRESNGGGLRSESMNTVAWRFDQRS